MLGAGWSGERVLIRLLSAAGSVRVIGQALARPVADPARSVRRLLRRGAGGPVVGTVVLPHHLWLVNGLDPTAFVADLRADGITVLSLARSAPEDRGLSLALCGPRSEVLPSAPRHLDAADVTLYRRESEYAFEWFGQVCPQADHRIVFEDDLLEPAARQATAERVAVLLGLEPWDAPLELEVPGHDSLWRLVVEPDALRADLAQLRDAIDA